MAKFNPLIFSGIDFTGTGGGGPAGAVQWKSPVETESTLPTTDNSPGDARVALDTDKIYVWDDVTSKWIDSKITATTFGSAPNDKGLTVSSVTEGNVTRATINLQPADEENPGAVSTLAQTFAGDKTFGDDVIVVGGIDARGGIDSSTTTLDIGAAASTINIGNPSSTVTIAGTTLYENVTDLLVKDKTITINDGGATSAGGAGIEVEENDSITGYVKVSSDRSTWGLKAPGQDGVAVIDPGLSGITLDESTADLLPLDGSRAMTGDLVMDVHNVVFDDNINTTLQVGSSGIEFSQQLSGSETLDSTQTQGGVRFEYNDSNTTANDYIDILYNNGVSVYSSNTNANVTNGGFLGSTQVYVERDSTDEYRSTGLSTDGVDLYINNNITSESFGGYLKSNTSTFSSIDLSSDKNLNLLIGSGYEATINAPLSMETNKIVNIVDPTDPQDAATKFYVDSLTVDVSQVTKEPTGFPNRDDSIVTFNDLTRTLTISPTSTTFDVYVKGEKFTKTQESIELSTVSGNHYIYYNSLGELVDNTTFDPNIFSDNALVSIVYWNNDTLSHVYFAEERHGLTMDGATHGYLHTVFGARYLSGLALENFSVDGTGNLAADAQFVADQGQIRDEDLLIVIAQQNDIPILYREDSLWRKKSADNYPVIYGGTAGYASGLRLPYNYFNGTSWELAEVVNNGYVLVHFFGTNDKNNGVVGIQGINQYNNVTDARNAAATEISSLAGLPFAEFVAMGSVVFETSNGYTNDPMARVRSISGADYVDFRGTQLYTPAGEATTHSLLSGLANDDHVQYLLVSGSRAMSGALNMGTHPINNIVDPSSAQDAATKNYVDGKVADSITDGVTTIAPSQNAVFDALTLKQDVGDYITELTGEVTAVGPGSVASVITANAVTNAKMAQMPALTLKGNNTALATDPLDLSVSDVQTLLSITPNYSGDIPRTSFTALDNSASSLPITDLVFSNATVRAFDVLLSVVRDSTYAEYNLKGIQKNSSWEMSQDYIGDDTGLVFSVTSTGQIEYTSTNTGFDASVIFRAITV